MASSLSRRILAPLGLLLLLPGCVVATVAGAAVGTAVKVTGTAVETAVDATTTTRQEADEDRGKAARRAEEQARRDARKRGADTPPER